MPMREGRRTNFGNCEQADSKRSVFVPEGGSDLCPQCEHMLQFSSVPNAAVPVSKWLAMGGIALAVPIIGFLYSRL